MQTGRFLISRCVLGRLLFLVRKVLTTVMLEATGVVGEVLTAATGEVIEGVEVDMVVDMNSPNLCIGKSTIVHVVSGLFAM